jgi:hypothetical protein
MRLEQYPRQKISAIFAIFWRFLPIFGDFCQLSAIFANYRRFLSIIGDFCQIFGEFANFRRCLPIFSAKALPCVLKINGVNHWFRNRKAVDSEKCIQN